MMPIAAILITINYDESMRITGKHASNLRTIALKTSCLFDMFLYCCSIYTMILWTELLTTEGAGMRFLIALVCCIVLLSGFLRNR